MPSTKRHLAADRIYQRAAYVGSFGVASPDLAGWAARDVDCKHEYELFLYVSILHILVVSVAPLYQ